MFRVVIEVNDGDSKVTTEYVSQHGSDLYALGCAVGQALNGVWNLVEFCKGEELHEGLAEFLPEEWKAKKEES